MYACMYTFTISLWWSFCAPVSKKWISLALFVVCRANPAVYGRVFWSLFLEVRAELCAHTWVGYRLMCSTHEEWCGQSLGQPAKFGQLQIRIKVAETTGVLDCYVGSLQIKFGILPLMKHACRESYWLPCWPSRGGQVLHQRWILGNIHLHQA